MVKWNINISSCYLTSFAIFSNSFLMYWLIAYLLINKITQNFSYFYQIFLCPFPSSTLPHMIQYDFYLIKFLSRFFSFDSLLGWNLPHTLTTGFLGSRWSWRPKRRKSWGEWCVSVYGLEKGKRKGFFSDCFSLKEMSFTCLLFLRTPFVQDSLWVLSDWWGAGWWDANQPTQGPICP